MNPIIFHIDDDPDDRDLMGEVIQLLRPDVTVIGADNGKEALEYLRSEPGLSHPPQLILLDLNMPVLSGHELLPLLKQGETTASIPVVVYTTSSNRKDELFCEQYGAHMITKPSTFQDTRSVVSWLLSCVKV